MCNFFHSESPAGKYGPHGRHILARNVSRVVPICLSATLDTRLREEARWRRCGRSSGTPLPSRPTNQHGVKLTAEGRGRGVEAERSRKNEGWRS